MPAVSDSPLFSSYYDNVDSFVPIAGSTYVYASSIEERSQLPAAWVERHAGNVRFVKISQPLEDSSFTATLPNGSTLKVSLRSRSQLSGLVDSIKAPRVYLDVTGLDHPTWAGLLRSILASRIETCAVYVEPLEYIYSATPCEGEIFDLSERIRGLQPIPGFASLQGPIDDFLFVPCLGFEGARLAYLVEQLEPNGNNIIPIIGLPGFRPEYPFLAYWANKRPLASTRAWRQVRFARANCPFSMYYTLSEISKTYPKKALRVAPIGTKPHAIGSVLFFLTANEPDHRVEIVYDHPIRKAKGTAGVSRVAVYHVSSFTPTV